MKILALIVFTVALLGTVTFVPLLVKERIDEPMETKNPGIPTRMMTDDGKIIHFKELIVPPWDMNGVAYRGFAHGLGANWTNIINIGGMLVNDALTKRYPIIGNMNDIFTGLSGIGVYEVDNTNITLDRLDGGFFDSVDFDDVAINRGYLVICYHE